jgi:hypothetical protein
MAETVMTIPLLDPSADSGTTAGNRPSREARLGQRPYFRFRLVSRGTPPELPLLLEQRSITPEEWDVFWSKIKALVLKVERLEKLYFCVLACVVASLWAVMTWFPLYDDTPHVMKLHAVPWNGTHVLPRNGTKVTDLEMEDDDALSTMVLQWVSAVIPMLLSLLAFRLYLSRKQSLLQAIEVYCKDGDEASTFHANGYGLECELLPSEMYASRLHLYILPVDRPYTRFEVYNGMLTFPGYNSSYLSSLALHADMECESVPLDDWNSFSSAMTQLYEPQRQRSLAAEGLIVMLLILPLVGPALEMVDYWVNSTFLIVVFLALLFVSCIYLVYRYYRFLGAKLTLVHELAMRLTPHGGYVEHRRVILHTWHGPYERHYVYLFPAIASDRSSTHDDTRSMESIRNRQSLSA